MELPGVGSRPLETKKSFVQEQVKSQISLVWQKKLLVQKWQTVWTLIRLLKRAVWSGSIVYCSFLLKQNLVVIEKETILFEICPRPHTLNFLLILSEMGKVG